jgi:FMN-dependent NADH-azoreductase
LRTLATVRHLYGHAETCLNNRVEVGAVPVLLHVDCSPIPGATTRRLAQDFASAWLGRHPEAKLRSRDIGIEPIPHVGAAFAQSISLPPASHTPEMRAAVQYAEALTSEFLAADRYLISMPMRIFTVPSTFKAYIEHIFHRDKVFEVTSSGYQGLLGGRKVLCITARGGDYRPGSPARRYDFQEPYLRALFEFCGVRAQDMNIVNADAMFSDAASRDETVLRVTTQLQELAEVW